MKPAPFDYFAPAELRDALAALADDDAMVIAGGQSLLPLLALRLARPALLVDIAGLDLGGITVDGERNEVSLGALVRHRALELDPTLVRVVPLLARAAALIGYPAIRNLGSLGGSLAHADPAAELPAALVALGGRVMVAGSEGTREIEAVDLFEGYFTTSLVPGELITEIVVPAAAPGVGTAFCEWSPRAGDFAVAGVAMWVATDADGVCLEARAAACGVASTPVPLGAALADAGVIGCRAADEATLRGVSAAVEAACANGDRDRPALAGQGLGNVLLEEVRYSDAAQPLSTTLLDYTIPEATDMVRLRVVHRKTPSGLEGGFRGMAEAAITAAPAALVGAIDDALRPLGVRITSTRLQPHHVRALVRATGWRPDAAAFARASST